MIMKTNTLILATAIMLASCGRVSPESTVEVVPEVTVENDLSAELTDSLKVVKPTVTLADAKVTVTVPTVSPVDALKK
jgi:hypothetical protein